MNKERDYFFDNLKAVLIFLVVLGHFFAPYPRRKCSCGGKAPDLCISYAAFCICVRLFCKENI